MLARTEPPPDKPSTASCPDDRSATRTPARWADLRLRALSAAVLLPVALVCIQSGGAAFAGLVGLIVIGLSYEWLSLCRKRSWPVALLFAALPLSVALTAYGTAASALLLLAVAAAAAIALGRGLSPARPLAFGIPYLGLAAVSLVWLRQQPGSGGANVIVLLLVVWASDIGAYIVGRAVGGPRLAPSISPGKTWSGAIGGVAAAGAVGLIASAILGNGLISWHPMTLHPVGLQPVLFAVLIGCVGQAGDLLESQLKRHFGVKDSGNIIPGHGGLLDRVDAVLTAAPATALLVLVLGRGVVLWA